MATSSQRTIAPRSNMSAHARSLNDQTIDSSPIFPTPEKCECQSPSLRHPHTPPSSGRSTSHENDLSSSQLAQSTSRPFVSNSECGAVITSSSLGSRRLKLRLTPRQNSDTASRTYPPRSTQANATDTQNDIRSSPCSSSSSSLKLKLRGVRAALKDSPPYSNSSFSHSDESPTRKCTSFETSFDEDYDTDSEIDILPPARKVVKLTIKRPAAQTSAQRFKKLKKDHSDGDYDNADSMFDAGDEDSSLASSPDTKLILSSNVLKRSERILDPSYPEHAKLIATASKAGSEYYDSDAEELPGNVKEANKPHLFRNVKWGALATDYSNPADFTTEPEFTQFVPGRFERLPDGTASDQKHKLIVKLTDKQHRQRIFLNPPPRDWNNQEAITALNKRTVQQIRRNTSIRFREVVEPYMQEEREWILAHLTEGKPSGGWKKFVDAFNGEFQGEMLKGCTVPRPERSHSSLTKEVERFGEVYAMGVVPRTMLQRKGTRRGKGKKSE